MVNDKFELRFISNGTIFEVNNKKYIKIQNEDTEVGITAVRLSDWSLDYFNNNMKVCMVKQFDPFNI